MKVDRNKVVELYQSGLNMSEIGRQLGHRHGIISYHLYKSGITIRKITLRNPKIKTEYLLELYKKGYSLPELSKMVSLSNQAIYARFIKYGFKPRTVKEALRLGYKLGKIKKPKGEKNPNWKGGRSIDSDGYIQLAIDGKQIPEHRLIWEKANGKIPDGWIIHHLNGNRQDNKLENLSALPRKRHSPFLIVEVYKQLIKKLEKELQDAKALWEWKNGYK